MGWAFPTINELVFSDLFKMVKLIGLAIGPNQVGLGLESDVKEVDGPRLLESKKTAYALSSLKSCSNYIRFDYIYIIFLHRRRI